MDEHLKQRLVGVTVIVALGVIFLPLIFDGGHHTIDEKVHISIPPPPNIEHASSIETITPLTTPPLAASQPGSSGIDQVQKPDPDVPPANTPDTPDKMTGSQQDKNPAATRQTGPVGKVAKPAAKTAQSNTTDSIAKPGTIPPATAAKKSAPVSSTAMVWVIQAGSFSNRQNAEKRRNRLRKNGFQSFIEPSSKNNKTFYRVHIGPETRRVNAEASLKKLQKKLNIKGIIVSYP